MRIAESSPRDRLDSGMVFVLNKSAKSEIINYARNVSFGVTDFKTAANTLLRDMGGFSLNAMYNGYATAMHMVSEGLKNVAEAYNAGTAFLDRQSQSNELRFFSQSLRDRMSQGRDRLELLGITIDEQTDTISFDNSVFLGLSQIEAHAAIGANIQIFHSLSRTTTEILTAPLSSHMRFSGLSYHYNYQLGRMVEDGFGLIESGMIVDRVV
jgi:hypothetical protein